MAAKSALTVVLCGLVAAGGASFNDNGLRGGLSGLRWSGWDGRQSCAALSFALPEDEAGVVAEVRRAGAARERVKVVGAGHSFSAIALSEGARYMSLDRMRAGLRLEREAPRGPPGSPGSGSESWLATVQGGMRLFELNDWLQRNGVALANLGATAEQSVAGAIATGTHGTGRELGSLSAAVAGLRLVDGEGRVQVAREGDDLLEAARVSLGALGVVTEVTLRVRPLFYLRETTVSVALEQLLARLPALAADNERLQWYVLPFATQANGAPANATLLLRDEVAEPEGAGCWARAPPGPAVPHAPSGGLVTHQCADLSFKALTDSRAGYASRPLYTEMEMHVPLAAERAVLDEFLSFLRGGLSAKARASPDLKGLFLGVRYVAADQGWLSPQYRRPTAVFSVIVDAGRRTDPGDGALFDECAAALERIAARHGAVPHWGKQNWADAAAIAQAYPRLPDFALVRKRLDPKGIFLNDYLVKRLGLGLAADRDRDEFLVHV